MRINKIIFSVCLGFLMPAFAFSGEVLKFTLFDGETVMGKLSLPSDVKEIRELVIYVHGTGPSTYDKRRGEGAKAFNYFDFFADEFNRRGIAFFTYNKRGVTPTDQPPYEKIDREKFRKVVPSVEVRDIATYIRTLRADKRLKKARIILLGWSEGTILAAMAAESKDNKIYALFLNGYVHENMLDVIKWQLSGGASMVNFRGVFDKDKDGKISQSEYESEDSMTSAFRKARLHDVKFERLDVTKDGIIDETDFALIQAPRYRSVLDAIEQTDEDWIWDNYFHVSIEWLKEHAALEANKYRLLRLKLPIYIFHGESDANCRYEGVLELRKSFDKARKKNLFEHIFSGHDHDLNFVEWLTSSFAMSREKPR